MKKRIREFLKAVVIGFWPLLCQSLSAQGTVQFGFEEYPVGTWPPFVTTPRPPGFHPAVVLGGAEGEKSLRAWGIVQIASPDGQPIQSYSLQAFIYPPGNFESASLRIGGSSKPIAGFLSWESYQGTLASPVQ